MRFMPCCLIPCCLAAVLAVTGCAQIGTPPAPLVLDPVGPAGASSVSAMPAGYGTLVVYSDWIPDNGIDADTHQRQSYRILRADGSRLEQIDNLGHPAFVALAPGNYLIDTVAAPYGRLRIPVQIVAGQTTPICLTGEFDPSWHAVSHAAFVTLPDGHLVGWHTTEGAATPSPGTSD